MRRQGISTAALRIKEPEYPKAAKLTGAILLPISVDKLDSPI